MRIHPSCTAHQPPPFTPQHTLTYTRSHTPAPPPSHIYTFLHTRTSLPMRTVLPAGGLPAPGRGASVQGAVWHGARPVRVASALVAARAASTHLPLGVVWVHREQFGMTRGCACAVQNNQCMRHKPCFNRCKPWARTWTAPRCSRAATLYFPRPPGAQAPALCVRACMCVLASALQGCMLDAPTMSTAPQGCYLSRFSTCYLLPECALPASTVCAGSCVCVGVPACVSCRDDWRGTCAPVCTRP